jgi:hypothetical protein
LQRAALAKKNETTNPDIPVVNTPIADPRARTVKASSSFGPTSKGDSNAVFVDSHFSKDIKWIGLVTGIIVILLIISYYVFK